MESIPILCSSCKLRHADKVTCAAFPAEIPASINLFDEVDHRQPVKGDHGITWVLDPTKRYEFDAWMQNHQQEAE